jgi:glycosyltransferase involved in cell wall biosynthesis
MKVVQITPGRFHHFDLARQMESHGVLHRVFTGYPSWKLREHNEYAGIARSKVETFPWVTVPYFALGALARKIKNLSSCVDRLGWISLEALDHYASSRLSDSDVLVGQSGCGLRAGRIMKSHGGMYVCDRGSTHIRFLNETMREEYRRWEVPYTDILNSWIEKEEREYELADLITVPSQFAANTFLSNGLAKAKLRVIPYGVDLGKFRNSGQPDPGFFQVLFVGSVGLRKGIPYLLKAFSQMPSSIKKRLIVAGLGAPGIFDVIRKLDINESEIQFMGHIPQAQLAKWMSRSNVLVLPSVEDGFGLVLAQALACGCPIIASTNTGALDLIEEGKEGFIVNVRDSRAITDRLVQLATQPELQDKMRAAALQRAKRIGGWDLYGQEMLTVLTHFVDLNARTLSSPASKADE